MRSILAMLLDHSNQILIFTGFSLLAMGATYLIYWASNRNRYIKYMPGVILIAISIYKLLNGLKAITTSGGLNNIYSFGIMFVSGFVSLCYALMLGISMKYRLLAKKAKVKKADA